jgi:membrane-bound serine protease (ClpP class)
MKAPHIAHQLHIAHRKMRWALLPLVLLALGAAAHGDILKIVVDGPIHPIAEEYIHRAVNAAGERNASALLIELRTPGGLADSTRQIMTDIVESKVPVIIYVAPSGSRAASAGFFILESADVAAMAPGTNTGAAHPVAMGGGDITGTMKEKVENDSAALMRSMVSRRGRNVAAAESGVRQSKSFTDQEALKNNLIDIVARNQSELLSQLDGRTITRWNGDKQILHLAGQAVQPFDMTVRQQILNKLMDPNLAFILLAIGALGLYVEFTNPGLIVHGIIGTLAIVLAVFALDILPVNWAALALIALAFVFFALEAKFTSYGALTAAGITSLVLGALLLVDGPIPQLRVQLWTALAVSLPFGVIASFLMTIALRARQVKVTTGVQGMVGAVGVARTLLSPEGKVFVHGEIWDAVSSSPIAPGDPVRIRNVRDFQLEVEPASVPEHSSGNLT